MNVLFIIGNCLKVNSSANLCHIAYINGFIDLGHNVELLTASDKNLNIDKSMKIPNVQNIYEYPVSLYEQLGNKKNSSNINIIQKNNEKTADKICIKSMIVSKLKRAIKKIYGVYFTDIIWYLNAKKFKTIKSYDLVVSIAYPPISHKLAAYLIKRRRIKTKKWIEIWEDPWSLDLVGSYDNDAVRREESKLVEKPDKVLYVSPLTAIYQKNIFSTAAEKMTWQPLPSYYSISNESVDFSSIRLGYFGDYVSTVRNLKPFLNVATKENIETYICGKTDLSYNSTNSVIINPRLPLEELKKYENKINVIVFLCNLKGGQIPGKIYQYSASNKAILFILDGTEKEKNVIKEYFNKFERYIFCDNNEKSILNAIKQIPEYIKDPKYTTPLDNFSSQKIVNSILNEVDM